MDVTPPFFKGSELSMIHEWTRTDVSSKLRTSHILFLFPLPSLCRVGLRFCFVGRQRESKVVASHVVARSPCVLDRGGHECLYMSASAELWRSLPSCCANASLSVDVIIIILHDFYYSATSGCPSHQVCRRRGAVGHAHYHQGLGAHRAQAKNTRFFANQ